MLNKLEENFTNINQKILRLKLDNQNLTQLCKILEKENDQLRSQYEAEKSKNKQLVEENKNIKIQASISGNTEYNRLMKARINRLIKEVDMCISQLENNEL